MKKNRNKIRSFISHIYRKHNLHKIVDEDFGYLINGQGTELKEGHILKRIMLEYHVIEKGLTMPNMRYGFGEKVLLALITDIKSYIDLYGNNYEQVDVAIKVVAEYKRVHNDASFTLNDTMNEAIESILKYDKTSIQSSQLSMNKKDFFAHLNDSFELFSYSRHSVRHFNGPVDIEKVKASLKLAQNAPSACNRQSTRVKIVTDKVIIGKIFEVQHGNRGFGHLADKLLVLTTDMQNWDIASYWGGYVDGGIYAMNLLYALHYNMIGACPLNANLNAQESRTIKKMLSIPDNESIFLFIAIGDVPETFKLANSHRTDYNNIMTVI